MPSCHDHDQWFQDGQECPVCGLQKELLAANTRISELTQGDPCWFDASPAFAFELLNRYRAALKDIIANEEAHNRGDALSAHIAKSVLGIEA